MNTHIVMEWEGLDEFGYTGYGKEVFRGTFIECTQYIDTHNGILELRMIGAYGISTSIPYSAKI